MYQYDILNYWNDADDLYVNYIITDTKLHRKANVINYYNTSDIECDYNSFVDEDIKKSLLKLIKDNNGKELDLPKVSELSPLLTYIYGCVCDSETNMCHIDSQDWDELLLEESFIEEDLFLLKKEVEKYNLDDYITIDTDEYKICGYGGLQCCFNDDRFERNETLER